MDRTYLDWNVPNWITVWLMATVGTIVVSFAIAFIRKQTAKA